MPTTIDVEIEDIQCPVCRKKGELFAYFCRTLAGKSSLQLHFEGEDMPDWTLGEESINYSDGNIEGIHCCCGKQWDSLEKFLDDTVGRRLENIPRPPA